MSVLILENKTKNALSIERTSKNPNISISRYASFLLDACALEEDETLCDVLSAFVEKGVLNIAQTPGNIKLNAAQIRAYKKGPILNQNSNALTNDSGEYVTVSDITLYVAPTGDDFLGNGSYSCPYATVEKALSTLPKIIQTKCLILVTAGDYTNGWPEIINPIFEDEGSLAFVGVGTPTVEAGPFTVSNVLDLGWGGQRITISTGSLGSEDALCGQTIQIVTGAHAGQGHQVVANTDTTIDVILHNQKLVVGDTFNLVTPAVKIGASKTSIVYRSYGTPKWDPDLFSYMNARLIIHNIWLDFAASTCSVDAMQIMGAQGASGPFFDFVRIDLPNTMYRAITMQDCVLPGSALAYHSDWVLLGATAFTNLDYAYGKVGLTISGSAPRIANYIMAQGYCSLADVVVKGSVSGTLCHSMQLLRYGVGHLNIFQGSLQLRIGVISGTVGSVGINADASNLDFDSSHVEKGIYAILLRDGTNARIEYASCSVTNITGSAVNLQSNCRVRQEDAFPYFLAAATDQAAYVFTAPATPIKGATWLAAEGDSVTDGKGAFITREDV
jgi:hypothetical protein